MSPAPPPPLAAIWHDVECGSYAADLGLWRELASGAGGPALELGAGTGRVSLDLARSGVEVVAIDTEPALLAELAGRAAAGGLAVETVCADARSLELGRRFARVLAPMQFVHLFGGRGRRDMLDAVRAHLCPGGLFAAALLGEEDGAVADRDGSDPLPDVREVGGWVYSSLPVEVAAVPGGLEVRRLRQIVAPSGELSEDLDVTRLDGLGPAEFEAEARDAGMRPLERLPVSPTDDHVGSIVCVVEAP